MKWAAFVNLGPPRPSETAVRSVWRSHYQVLGLDPAAEPFLVEAAYRAQMRRRHPDRGGSTAGAQLINEAYRVLRNPEARARYDEELRSAAAAVRAAAAAAPRPPPSRRLAGAGVASRVYTSLGLLLVAWAVAAVFGPLERREPSVAAAGEDLGHLASGLLFGAAAEAHNAWRDPAPR